MAGCDGPDEQDIRADIPETRARANRKRVAVMAIEYLRIVGSIACPQMQGLRSA
jgi:hypothetical protein